MPQLRDDPKTETEITITATGCFFMRSFAAAAPQRLPDAFAS